MLDTAVNFIHSVFFQLVAFFTVSIAIGSTFVLKFRRFNSHNPPPAVYGVYPVLVKEATKSPPLVKCGMYINEFSQFSVLTSEFIADLFIWFVFRPSHIAKDVVENFTIEKGLIISKDKRETKLMGDKLFVQYKVRVSFSSSLYFSDFPFDDHRLYITLINDNLTPEELHFKGSEMTLRWNPELNISGWQLINVDVKSGYKSASLDKHHAEKISYPCITFSLDFKRQGIKQALIVILPMLGMFLVSYMSITSNFAGLDAMISVITYSFGCIMGLLGYRFVLETITPRVGYFTLTDHIFFIFLTLSFFVFLFQLYLAISAFSPQTTALLNAIAVLAIPIMLFLMFFVILNKNKFFRRKM